MKSSFLFMAGLGLLAMVAVFVSRSSSTLSAPIAQRSAARTFLPRIGFRQGAAALCNKLSRRNIAINSQSDYWIRDRAASVIDSRNGVEEFSHSDAGFWDDIVTRDHRGLPTDVANAVTSATDSLRTILTEQVNGPRLLATAFELDPMPWWTFSDLYMRMQILKEYGEKTGEVNALLLDPSVPFDQENINLGPNWVVARIGEPVDFGAAKRLFVYGADVNAPNRIEFLKEVASRTQSSDIVCINCSFGYIGDPEPRQMRQVAREHFVGGMDTVDMTLFPITKLDEECRGDSADLAGGEVLAYPMPQWMREAGYKGTGNLAISGCSGTGKSSFMNAMRGIDSHDAGAANVGNVETTMVATPYTFTDAACQLMEDDGIACSGQEHFRLWDLPGAGTPKFPLNSYLRVMG